MFDYLRYYFSPLVQVCAGIGIYIGGTYSWVGISTLAVFAVVDGILPRDTRERHINNRVLADIPVWMGAIFSVLLFVLLAWKIGQGEMALSDMIGGTLSVAWLGVIVGVPSTHELYHQRGVLQQLVGIYSQVIYLDSSRNIAHMVGHHLDVGTPADCDTAPRGTNLYSFAPAAVYHSTVTAWRLESDALQKRGKSRWSVSHRVWKAAIALAIFLTILYSLGGMAALVCGLAGASLARVWIETFNYFQHYGQVRLEGKPIARRHVWNHLQPISRITAFEITNHADHHQNAYIPYYKLKPDTTAVKLPSVFICFIAALIPPVWNKLIIMPALKEWDLNHASAEEKELARQQNINAGWPDWFEATAA